MQKCIRGCECSSKAPEKWKCVHFNIKMGRLYSQKIKLAIITNTDQLKVAAELVDLQEESDRPWWAQPCDPLHRRRRSLSGTLRTWGGSGSTDLLKTSWELVWGWSKEYSPAAQGFVQRPPLVSLTPSWPNLLQPQPNTAPERVRAKLWAPPADIWPKGMACRDWTSWAVGMLCPVSPSPSWPYRFWPQEKIWPPAKQTAVRTGRRWDGLGAIRDRAPSSPLASARECQYPQATRAICTSDKLLMFLTGFYKLKKHGWQTAA